MAIMEKRVVLGVQKKKPNKRNKKKLLKRVLNYLKSDCYLFAPLISSSRSHKVEFKEPAKENKRLVKRVGEYLLSDCYMYAPLTVPPRSFNISSKGIAESHISHKDDHEL